MLARLSEDERKRHQCRHRDGGEHPDTTQLSTHEAVGSRTLPPLTGRGPGLRGWLWCWCWCWCGSSGGLFKLSSAGGNGDGSRCLHSQRRTSAVRRLLGRRGRGSAGASLSLLSAPTEFTLTGGCPLCFSCHDCAPPKRLRGPDAPDQR